MDFLQSYLMKWDCSEVGELCERVTADVNWDKSLEKQSTTDRIRRRHLFVPNANVLKGIIHSFSHRGRQILEQHVIDGVLTAYKTNGTKKYQ